jgi:hypothetical protein
VLAAAADELRESAPMLDRDRSSLDAVVSAEGCLLSQLSRADRCRRRTVPAARRTTLREALAPGAIHGLPEKGQSLARIFDDGRDQPAVHGELLDQWPRDIGAGRRDADPVVGGVVGVPESAVAVNEDDVCVAGPFQVLAGEVERCGVDLDGHDQALRTHHLPGQRCAVARSDADLEEQVALVEAERLVEQWIAVRAGDRGSSPGRGSGISS